MNCIVGKLYKIWNTVNFETYIGTTTKSLNSVMIEHKNACMDEKYADRQLYQLMNEVGIQHFHIETVCTAYGETVDDLRETEYGVRQRFATVNKNIEPMTLEEWLEYNRQFIITQADKPTTHKQYKQEKTNPNQVCNCECGLTYTLVNKIRHKRTQIHRNRMKELEIAR